MLKLKYKIPPFVFGVTIGLLIGIVFFIFKIDDYIKKISKPSIESIKITEQSMDGLLDQNEDTISIKKLRLSAKKSPTINYSEVDQLLNDDEDLNIITIRVTHVFDTIDTFKLKLDLFSF